MALIDKKLAYESLDKVTLSPASMMIAKLAIDSVPVVDAELVLRGHWKGWTTSRWTGKYNDNGDPKYIDYIYYTCSRCYRKSVVRESYCPNCGAKMEEGADNG